MLNVARIIELLEQPGPDGRPTFNAEISNGGIDPRDLDGGAPVQLRLACENGEDDGTTVLRFTYAEKPPITITDRHEATGTRSGFLVTEQLDIDRETLAVLERFDLLAR